MCFELKKDVNAVVEQAREYANKNDCTRFVNARVRMLHGDIAVTYSHSDWFCSDSSVYRADTNGEGEWL